MKWKGWLNVSGAVAVVGFVVLISWVKHQHDEAMVAAYRLGQNYGQNCR